MAISLLDALDLRAAPAREKLDLDSAALFPEEHFARRSDLNIPGIDGLQNRLQDIDQAIETERDERAADDAELRQDLDGFRGDLQFEADERERQDAMIRTSVVSEREAREAGDNALDGRADALELEVTTARNGFPSLDGRLDAGDQALADEVAAREAADHALDGRTDALELEVTTARNGFPTLDGRLDAGDQALADEVTARLAADAIHDDKISGYGSRDILDLAKKYVRAGYDNVVFGINWRILSAYRERDDTSIIGTRALEMAAYRVDNDPRFLRSGLAAAVLDRLGRIVTGLRLRDDTFLIGATGLETGGGWRMAKERRLGRSGLIAPVIDSARRLISAYRLRDGAHVFFGRRLDVAGIRLDRGDKYARSGIVGALFDRAGHLIRGQHPRLDREMIGAAGIQTRFQAWNGIDPRALARSGFLRADVDPARNILTAVKADGTRYAEGEVQPDPPDHGFELTLEGGAVISNDRKTGARLKLSRTGQVASAPLIAPDGMARWTADGTTWFSPVDVAKSHRVMPMREVLGVGDSLMEADWGAEFATMSGIPFRNIGRSAATSRNCAARVGAVPLRLYSVTGEIPASGTVQVSTLDKLGFASFYAEGSVSGIPALWGGVAGMLSWDRPSGVMRWTRTTPGAAIPLTGSLPCIWPPIENITGAALPDLLERRLILDWGRNNPDEPERILADFEATIAAQPTAVKQFLVCPFMPERDEVLTNHPRARNRAWLLAECRKRWPDNTVDKLAAFIAAGNPADPDDAAAIAAGYPPPSLMQPDRIHPNAAGRTVTATFYVNIFQAKGWA
ncbi:hypothetical protein BJF92_12245 [Rhizobium rhizosphaerae]|uniref:Uncharacterized protein n=1 Tax=Xaviernesmea rhizosphaerae TaxID=1672749 RepID=A0A1Q9ANC7_9HYPH|nr:hypothetical protein [Xaviernesmea rhizosphaerae]OLP56835.1 hypothetical protein BJF92_12245 [Xaviernesmea rhizosphaerae]